MSLLAKHSPGAEVTGLYDIPAAERPPVMATHFAFRIMVGLGMLMLLLVLYGFWQRNHIENRPHYLKILVYAIPLPYLCCEVGWMVAEVGRQPWIVYGLMRTADAVSPVAASQVAVSLAAFVIVYSLVGVLAFKAIARAARHNPEEL